MIVENGSVTMDLDVNRLNGIGSAPGRPTTLQFAVAANSFFSILVFNDLLRGPDHGSMTLVPQNSAPALPASLGASIRQLAVEKLPSGAAFDLAVRDGKTGFVFFNVEGGHYDYDANAKLLSVNGGRLLVSNEFAKALGRPSDAGAVIGQISIGATMEAIEINNLDENGNVKSASLPALNIPLLGPFPAPMSSSAVCLTLSNPTMALSEAASASPWGLTPEQRDRERGLVCLAEQRPSIYSAESLPNEWRRH